MKSVDWVGNAISIGIFAFFAMASYGLSEYLERSRFGSSAQNSASPNAIIENPKIIRSGPDGKPRYRLEAMRITHNEAKDESLFERPFIASLAPDKPRSTMQSNTALATDHQDRVDLIGDVVITRDAYEQSPAARLTTTKATVLIEEERAMTDEPVFLQRGLSTLRGIGLKFDQKTQKMEIMSESRMVIPKENKGRP